MNFDFKNGCKNEFEDNHEKSCSSSRNRVPHKIDFKVVGPEKSQADSVGVKRIDLENHKVSQCEKFRS